MEKQFLDWDNMSEEFKAKYNKVRSIPGLGQNVRQLCELMAAVVDERLAQLSPEKPDEDEYRDNPPVKRRGRPPKSQEQH